VETQINGRILEQWEKNPKTLKNNTRTQAETEKKMRFFYLDYEFLRTFLLLST